MLLLRISALYTLQPLNPPPTFCRLQKTRGRKEPVTYFIVPVMGFYSKGMVLVAEDVGTYSSQSTKCEVRKAWNKKGHLLNILNMLLERFCNIYVETLHSGSEDRKVSINVFWNFLKTKQRVYLAYHSLGIVYEDFPVSTNRWPHSQSPWRNLDRLVWLKQTFGRIPLFALLTVTLSAVSVLALLLPYLSYSQPAKCAKWSQVSACPRRVNERMNNK